MKLLNYPVDFIMLLIFYLKLLEELGPCLAGWEWNVKISSLTVSSDKSDYPAK